MTPNWIIELEKLNPCTDALEWANQFRTAEEAWVTCERGDWMLWYASRVGLTPERHQFLVKATCKIVRRQLYLIPAGENRPIQAIEASEFWAEKPNTYRRRKAAEAAEAAAWAAEAAVGAVGAAEAAKAAGAAKAAEAAWAAAETAVEAPMAASIAAWAAELKIQADIVREFLSCPIMEEPKK